jgi:flagellar hook-length control protein FliK
MIEVEHSAARDVLLANLPQLQSRLTDQGLNVSQFDVQVVDPNQMGHGGDPGWEARDGRGSGHGDTESNRSSRYIDRLNNQLDRPSAEETARLVHSLWTRKNGELDVRF